VEGTSARCQRILLQKPHKIEKVHVDGPGISGNLGSCELTRLMIDLTAAAEEGHAEADAEGRVRSG
jgi:hypothetical protein